MPTDFTLPELGENVSAGDVVRVLVAPGDTVAKDQPVLELETDKATIEVPSSVAGGGAWRARARERPGGTTGGAARRHGTGRAAAGRERRGEAKARRGGGYQPG